MDTTVFCPICYEEYELGPSECKNCGYPFKGTEIEKQKFVSLHARGRTMIKEARNSANYARLILFIVGGINFVVAGIILLSDAENILALPTLGFSFLLIVLGFFSYRDPFYFLLLGFLVLLFMYGLNYFLDPAKILNGLILKIVFISTFIMELIRIRQSEKVQKQIILPK